MEHLTDSQYDDDLTIGAEEYDDSFQSDIDLFEFGGDEESPISRLKTLVLSLDWEITDEVLLQFIEEILDLKDVWAHDKVNMVYLQALEKIGRYIYREKADSHPHSIKLLLGMYYNLERIVLSEDLSEKEKKKILLDDVRRFEKLKQKIGKPAGEAESVASSPQALGGGEVVDLHDLKAIVLGIDWEITERDLVDLRGEVSRLEEKYRDSRPRLVFLQGIGTLGAYIRKKKSNSHADAFKLLHSFYEGLEKLVGNPGLTLTEEKEILRPEVEKFNAFKELIAQTLTREEPEGDEYAEELEGYQDTAVIAPAFADMPEDSVHGFQEEAEAAALGLETPANVDAHINKFFGEDEQAEPVAVEPVEETPAAVSAFDDSAVKEAEALSDAFFGAPDEAAAPIIDVDKEIALQGVDVETEADDDSDEEALPVIGGEVAPALADSGDMSAFSEEVVAEKTGPAEDEFSDEIAGKLDDFFSGEETVADSEKGTLSFAVPAEIALQGVDVESEGDEEDEELAVPAGVESGFDEIAPAFSDMDELEETAGHEPAPALEPALAAEVEFEAAAEPDDEVESHVEDFFTLEEEPLEETTTSEAGVEDGPEVEEEVFAALPDEDTPVVEPEEDVVFELTEEEPVEEPALTVEVAPAEPEAIAEPELEIEPVEEPQIAGEEVGEAEEDLAPAFAETADDTVAGAAVPGLGDLRGCVDSLSLELEDSIIQGLFTEISSLRGPLAGQPLQKTYLELLSTVARHVDQFRYDADDESNSLLMTIMDDLENSAELDQAKAQEALFANTCKVLQWQQKMLHAQAVRSEDGNFTFSEVPPAVVPEPEESPAVELEEAFSKEGDGSGESIPISGEEVNFTDIVCREINLLRDTLKKEIAELRKTVQENGGRL